jgi:hypothetical protein
MAYYFVSYLRNSFQGLWNASSDRAPLRLRGQTLVPQQKKERKKEILSFQS